MSEHLSAYQCIAEALEEMNLQYVGGPEDGVVKVTMRGSHSAFEIFLTVEGKPARLRVWAPFPVIIPERNRSAVCELMARMNNLFVYGAYLLDLDDGELEFSITLPRATSPGLVDQISYAVVAIFVTADDTFRPFYRLLFDSDLSPAEAAGEFVLSRRASCQDRSYGD
jgi:hypothetical protein